MPLLGFFVFIVVLFVFNFHLLFHPVETSWKEQFYLELARVPFGSFCRFLSSLLSFYLVMESGVEVSWGELDYRSERECEPGHRWGLLETNSSLHSDL